MAHIAELLQAHPRATRINASELQQCIDACFDGAQSCFVCSDACLGEANVQELIYCIRLNLDCADICMATGTILSRQTEPEMAILRQMAEACRHACRLCAEECERHANMHEHCRICAAACRACEWACMALLQATA